ncbi:Uncharacterised protein [Bordetella pertussis]|nr:Uncharacterised protein [Bordetella pertussis]
MASRSCGVAPSALSALTTSARLALVVTRCSAPPSWRTSICVLGTTTVWPSVNGVSGWNTWFWRLMITDRLPCATAASSIMTVRFITTEPVRALMMTLAVAGARATCRFSTCDMNAGIMDGSSGPRTWITRPSSAMAVPAPNWRLMAVAAFCVVPKSVLFISRYTMPSCAYMVGTARSTMAPLLMRPPLSWLICTLEPPAEAPAPPTRRLPWAMT